MVRGLDIAVTAVALMYQCAETTRIARGRGTAAPNARHAAVYRLCSSVFIGLPWPMNAAGIRICSMLPSVEPAGAVPCSRDGKVAAHEPTVVRVDARGDGGAHRAR